MLTRVIKALFFSCMVLMCLPAIAQVPVNQTDAAEKKQGIWRKTDSAGHLIYAGQFRDNVPVDTFRYYYPDGKIKTLSVFSGNGHQALSSSWYENGRPMAKGMYRDEKRDSLWQFFSDYDGALLSEENYKSGIKQGLSRTFYPQGGVSETINWKDGMKDGASESFFSDGKVKMRTMYKNGEKSGPFSSYYYTGTPMITGGYLDGHQHGVWKYFSEKGEVVRTETYDQGVLLSKTPADQPSKKTP